MLQAYKVSIKDLQRKTKDKRIVKVKILRSSPLRSLEICYYGLVLFNDDETVVSSFVP